MKLKNSPTMAKKKKSKAMGRTIIIIDDETKSMLVKTSKSKGLSASAYIRMIIRENAK